MSDTRLFTKLLQKCDDDDAAFNMYLVAKGARDAYLIEFANYSPEQALVLVDIARKLPNVHSDWERPINNDDDMPARFLIAQQHISFQRFQDA